MKVLRNIFKNPFAIATASVHWVILFYCLIFEETGLFSKTISMHRNDQVYQWLIYLNFVPLTIIETIGNVLNATIGMILILDVLLILFALLIVNFQWLFIGYCFSKLLNLFEQKQIKISLN